MDGNPFEIKHKFDDQRSTIREAETKFNNALRDYKEGQTLSHANVSISLLGF
jgi:hypothetical protein